MSDFVFTPATQPSLAVAGTAQRFPVSRVFCVGRNYPWSDGQGRSVPLFFMKPASSVIDAQGEIAYPPQTEEFCHEIELVVAIGSGGADIPENRALEHVWGYAAGLDLTRRDQQRAAKQAGMPWEGAKAFDGSAPISAIQPVSRQGHAQEGAVWLQVNGQERQRSALQHQLWSVAEIISHLSRSLSLLPGDLIMTGTPEGVAALQPGDRIRAAVEGVGQIDVQVGPRAA
ncbi:fumarylacetoacetate hydrolase family protein [Pseudomonas sp. DTU_2021_1001937_2_SI_NGA_ILE_001]|uniref:fumarylacetoacetate hydrolase family protein n=1 Tax=Pseudomonas sp. DTU_2021_1001937_2_SI_NGA_ILE_001 TaxID=3077589 RepID=UPI0025D72434|nr:fumarylacetoacetate hydrolase family protein [Pseudomonas sp. DTU_2021_1001937_2_SI_NGA_ILE_001]WNW13412.1 fumarylacetoacetate hydrolase family protein [Pseudomonas sp. DTU_2021_1001937_2_SI_NGA_ILE_001]